jgi:hypothetical protein
LSDIPDQDQPKRDFRAFQPGRKPLGGLAKLLGLLLFAASFLIIFMLTAVILIIIFGIIWKDQPITYFELLIGFLISLGTATILSIIGAIINKIMRQKQQKQTMPKYSFEDF